MHYRVNEIGDIQTEEPVHGGLTAFGRAVVQECNRLGIVVDCAHATFATTVGVLEASDVPVMVSHSHLDHAERPHPRLLSDDHARAVSDAGGLIGAWPSGVTSTTLEDFVDEILRLVELIGIDHVAIGTDLDANYKPVVTAHDDFGTLADRLASRGLTSERDRPDPRLQRRRALPSRGGLTPASVCADHRHAVLSAHRSGQGSGVLGEVLEGGRLVVVGLLGEAEHALADDVALHLVGAAVDGRAPGRRATSR